MRPPCRSIRTIPPSGGASRRNAGLGLTRRGVKLRLALRIAAVGDQRLSYGFEWAVRRSVWDWFALTKTRANKPAAIPVPTQMDAPLAMAPMREVFPTIDITAIPYATSVPKDEAQPVNRAFYDVQAWLSQVFPPHMRGLPETPADPDARLAEAYRPSKRALFPAPQRPVELAGPEPDLGALALAGPYYGYLRPAAEARWEWDLTALGPYEHRPELHNLGCRVLFEKEGAGVKPVSITCELGEVKPGEAAWPKARAIALCAVTTHCGLVRHFNGVHLCFGAIAGIAARNAFAPDHPVLRLIWPHVYGTQYSNNQATLSQLEPAGDFAAVYSYTVRGLFDLFEGTYKDLRFAAYDPVETARTDGLAESGIVSAGATNLIDLHNVFEAHTSRYLGLYYHDDGALAADAPVGAWLAAMDQGFPGGLPDWMRPLTVAGLARFIAVLMDIEMVEHELRGTMLWNYQLWTDVNPIRVYRDGRREPVDVYQRLVNTNLTLNVNRAELMRDYAYLGLDERGAEAFRAFLSDLKALQARMDDQPRKLWRLYPDMLNANMNA